MAGKNWDTYSLSRRWWGLALSTEYVQNLYAVFRVLVQNSCWQDGATVGFAHGLVGKYFPVEKYSFLNLSSLVSILWSAAFSEHPSSTERAALCPPSPCMVLSSPTLGQHAHRRGMHGRTITPSPIPGGPCHNWGSASSRPARVRTLPGSALGWAGVGWAVPLCSLACEIASCRSRAWTNPCGNKLSIWSSNCVIFDWNQQQKQRQNLPLPGVL